MTKLIKRYDQELGAGITPSLPEFKAPFFISGQNVRFGPDGVEPVEPWIKATTQLESSPVRGMITARITGASYLFWGTAKWLFYWDGITSLAEAAIPGELSGGKENEDSGGPATVWSFAAFGDNIWASDGERAIKTSDALADFVDLVATDEPTTAEIIKAIGGRPVAFNTNDGGNVIEWPSLGDFTDWLPTANNDAGNLTLHDAAGPLIAVAPLGTAGSLIYTNGSIHAFFDAGIQLVFGQRRVITGVGAVSKNAVVPVSNQHYVFGQSGIYVTDGITYRYIDDPMIRRYIKDLLDTDKLSHVFGWYHSARDAIQFFFPTVGGSGMSAVEYRRANGSWSIQTSELTSAVGLGVFSKALSGDQYGSLFEMDVKAQGGGGGSSLGDPLVGTPSGFLRTGCGVAGCGAIGFGGKVLDG